MMPSVVHRLAERDRALLQRLRLRPEATIATRFWCIVTHAGGAAATLLAAMLPIWAPGPVSAGARRSALVLVVSHVLVQLVKRFVGRPRPDTRSLIAVPDRFSFPSGHSAAAMSVAIGYSSVFPDLAGPLVAAAALVGASRVVLGVHYPADVVAGQLLAAATAALVVPIL